MAESLRYLDFGWEDPDAGVVADALATFLVRRCESHHAGWRTLRQVVVDSAADAPWERCARRAIPGVAAELLEMAAEGGRTPLSRAQHAAAQWRAREIAPHVDPAALLREAGLPKRRVPVDEDAWRAALVAAVRARSREGLARELAASLDGPPPPEDGSAG